MATLPYDVNHQVNKTYDGAFSLSLDRYTKDSVFLIASLENIGKLLYRMGESCFIYDDVILSMNLRVMDAESIAYEIWTAIVACQGNKKGRKNPASVYVVSAHDGQIVKHFRHGA